MEDIIRQKVCPNYHKSLSQKTIKKNSKKIKTEKGQFIQRKLIPQITAALTPSVLEIYNDSHKHAHHVAMKGVQSKETHFRYVIYKHTTSSPNTLGSQHDYSIFI